MKAESHDRIVIQEINFQQVCPMLTYYNSIAHCAKDLLIVKKIQPNLIPLKTIPIGCVGLNSKIKFAVCH